MFNINTSQNIDTFDTITNKRGIIAVNGCPEKTIMAHQIEPEDDPDKGYVGKKNESGPFRVLSRPCPRSVREVSEGRYLEVNFKLQCSYLHFFRGHFADRGVNGH